jgi:outer membrane protein assembly factor BamB
MILFSRVEVPMAPTRRLPKVMVFLVLAGAVSPARADHWPQWMGPKRDGVWRESGILDKFPAGGPKALWRVPINSGYSGPAVAGNRIYVMDRQKGEGPRTDKGRPGTERVLCLDATNGKVVWEHSYDCPYRIDFPTGPRCTPAVDDGKVYTLGAMGDLYCFDAATGKVHWSRQLMQDYHLKDPPFWGFASHPLIDGDRLFCLVGGEGSAVVAFHKDSGKELWKALTATEIGYAPPQIIEAGGKRQLIIWHTDAVAGLDPATGEVHWSVAYPIEGKPRRPEVSIAAPRICGDQLFLTSFYQGATMLRLAKDKPAATVQWNRKSTSETKFDEGLHTVMCTPVFKDGYIYGVCGQGELRCLKADNGDRVWETTAATGGKSEASHAFLIEHGNRYFLFNDQGDLIIARLTPQGYEEISRAHLLDTSQSARGKEVVWSHPAFANRCVYARNDKEIVCVSLAKEPH